MKKLLVILVLALVGNVAFAETTDKKPKRPSTSGFNYSKHYRKQHRTHVLNRIFNLNGCKHYVQGRS
jgi:hypothetical protein